MLQVRTGQGVGGGRGAQQLLRAAAIQAVVTAVRGAHALGRGLHAPTVAPEGAGRGADPLTDGAAWHHGEILPEKTTTKNKGFKGPVCKMWLIYDFYIGKSLTHCT